MITILGSLAIVFAFMAAAVVLVVGVWRRRKAARAVAA
jgi:hypothetical protein